MLPGAGLPGLAKTISGFSRSVMGLSRLGENVLFFLAGQIPVAI
ncbi:hypothetical protein Z945_1965 [Sulfitobacter noctilucae]|nr:hypothetical protein Z945_1965 [Sulfitobacter noctilucae]